MRWVLIGAVTQCLDWLGSVNVSRGLVALSLLGLFHAPAVGAREVTLAWNANSEPILGGYRLYYGTAHRNYTSVIDVGNQTTYTVYGLADDQMYCFAVTAYDTTRTVESGFSNEVALIPTTLGAILPGSAAPGDTLAMAWECR
jgi:fibronectin type 3 domain-containing protein